jgi:hypothetical protein
MRILSGPAKIAFGFGLGVMAAEVVKEVLPAFRGLGRPLLKAAVKSGMILAENSRVKIAELRETIADVTAEAQAEMARAPAEPVAREHAAGIM